MCIRKMRRSLFVVMLALLLGAMVVRPIAADGPTTVTYTYDDAGRLVAVAYGDGTTIAYTYDVAGNLLTRTVRRSIPIYLPLVLRSYIG